MGIIETLALAKRCDGNEVHSRHHWHDELRVVNQMCDGATVRTELKWSRTVIKRYLD